MKLESRVDRPEVLVTPQTRRQAAVDQVVSKLRLSSLMLLTLQQNSPAAR